LGEKPILDPLSKRNTGMAALRAYRPAGIGRIPLFLQATNLAANLAFDLRERLSVSKARRKQVESMSKASCKLA